MSKPVVVISKHKKHGFWQADLYKSGRGADFPNDYFTMSSSRSVIDVARMAEKKWPDVRIDLEEASKGILR